MTTSSTVARWELAHRIKVRRNELGISVDQIATHLGFTRNFFSAVENERSMLATDKLGTLMRFLQFDERSQAELLALDEAARKRGWWELKDTTDVLDDEGSRLLGLEQGASEIRTFDSLLIPGLLQLPDYIRLILENDPVSSPLDVDRLISIRIRRQQELFQRRPTFITLLTEAALRQRWGTSDQWAEQARHILEAADSGIIELRILTFDVFPGLLASSSTLVLFNFVSHHLPEVGYQEAIRDIGLVEQGDPQFERLRLAWRLAAEQSLEHDASMRFIRELLDEPDNA